MKYLLCIAIAFVLISKTFGQLSFGFSYTPTSDAIVVEHVFKNSPAEKAGLKAQDLIIAINGIRMDTVSNEKKAAVLQNAPVKTTLLLGDVDEDGELWKGSTINITKEDKSHFLNLCLQGNCKNGSGKYLDGEGAEYTGTFKNGKREGKGKSVTINGYIYEGDWKNDRKEGKGVLTFQSSGFLSVQPFRRIEGDWKNDMLNGQANYVYVNGAYFTGEVKDNLRNGKGKMVLKDSTVYEGEWKNDKLNGKGTQLLRNGDKRTGNFIDDLLEGDVIVYTKATNSTTTVLFKKGKPQ